MRKKILAALTALSLCVCAAGCGTVGGQDGDSSSDSAAENSSAVREESESSGNDEDSSAEEEDGAEAEESAAGDAALVGTDCSLNPDNVAVYTFENIEDMPTHAEAAAFASMALEQYRAAFEGDVQRFMDLMALDTFADTCAEMVSEDYDDSQLADHPTKSMAIYVSLTMISWLHYDELGEIMSHTEYSEEQIAEELRELFASCEYDESVAEILSETVFSDVPTIGVPDGIGEDTVVWTEVYEFERDGEDMYISFDVGVPAGDGSDECYVIESALCWYSGGNWGVVMGAPEKKTNAYAGMTAKEIEAAPVNSRHFISEDYPEYEEPKEEEISEEEKELLDRAYLGLLSAFWVYHDMTAEYYNAGDDVEEMIKKDFPQGYTEKGLDLSKGEPSAEGDKLLYKSMEMNDVTEGFVRLEEYTLEKDYLSVYYTSPSGTEIIY